MSLLEKIESRNDENAISESRKKEIDKEVAKLKAYEKLGLIGE